MQTANATHDGTPLPPPSRSFQAIALVIMAVLVTCAFTAYMIMAQITLNLLSDQVALADVGVGALLSVPAGDAIPTAGYVSLWGGKAYAGYGPVLQVAAPLPALTAYDPFAMEVVKLGSGDGATYALLEVYREDPTVLHLLIVSASDLSTVLASAAYPMDGYVVLMDVTPRGTDAFSLAYAVTQQAGMTQQQAIYVADFTVNGSPATGTAAATATIAPDAQTGAIQITPYIQTCYQRYSVPSSEMYTTTPSTNPTVATPSTLIGGGPSGASVGMVYLDGVTLCILYPIPIVADGQAYRFTLYTKSTTGPGFDLWSACMESDGTPCGTLKAPSGAVLGCTSVSDVTLQGGIVGAVCTTTAAVYYCTAGALDPTLYPTCVIIPDLPVLASVLTITALPGSSQNLLGLQTPMGVWTALCTTVCESPRLVWAATDPKVYLLQAVANIAANGGHGVMFMLEDWNAASGFVRTVLSLADISATGEVTAAPSTTAGALQLRAPLVIVHMADGPNLEVVYVANPPVLAVYSFAGGATPLGVALNTANPGDVATILTDGLLTAYSNLQTELQYHFDPRGNTSVSPQPGAGVCTAVTPNMTALSPATAAPDVY